MTIHWCGTGLSAIPGIRRLIIDGNDIVVWNRTIEKAISAVGDITKSIKEFDIHELKNCLGKDDIIVSMLPADWHVPLANLSLELDKSEIDMIRLASPTTTIERMHSILKSSSGFIYYCLLYTSPSPRD